MLQVGLEQDEFHYAIKIMILGNELASVEEVGVHCFLDLLFVSKTLRHQMSTGTLLLNPLQSGNFGARLLQFCLQCHLIIRHWDMDCGPFTRWNYGLVLIILTVLFVKLWVKFIKAIFFILVIGIIFGLSSKSAVVAA